MTRTIMYAFWGRRENVELQLPFIQRILDENPGVEFHGWDLARDPSDSKYLRGIADDRIQVQTAFYGPIASRGQVRVWQHYAHRMYRDTVFVKLDDDDIFIETDSFASFVQAAVNNPDKVISATVVNNGACTKHIPDLWDMHQTLDIPLLDVHLSAEYAENCHRWFFANWETLIGQPVKLTPADTWVSINAISYTYEMGRKIASLLGTRPPANIMDREYPRIVDGRIHRYKVGDEGAVNMHPILIHPMAVAHFSFGPQKFTPDVETELRKLYADVARQYL